MKKIYCLAIAVIIISGLCVSTVSSTRISASVIENTTATDDWDGNFSGVWGLNLFGQPLEPLGWVEGNYSHNILVHFEGTYARYNDTNIFGISSLIIGPFMLGRISNLTSENSTIFVGLGGINENTSEFYFRIMSVWGPTFYMYGNCTKFV